MKLYAAVLDSTLFVLFAVLILVLISGCDRFFSHSVDPMIHDDIKVGFNEYLEYKPYKAFAVAVDEDGRHAYGFSYSFGTQAIANDAAIEYCSEFRSGYDVESECELYAEDNDVVY